MVILEKNCRRSTVGRSISASPARRKISCHRPYRRSLRRNPEEISNCNMPVITRDKPGRGAVPPPPVLPGDGGRDGSAGDYGGSFPISKGQLGIWILLTAIVMLFAGLTSAYIVLRGLPTWQNIALPSLLWPNTAVLVLSSFTIELSRGAIRRNQLQAMRAWLVLSGLLGLVFIAGQLAAWRQLVHAGVYLPSTLQSSFFYVLTGLHGVHILGGIAGLSLVLFKALRNRLTVFNHEPLKLCATYWHVMDAIWIYLFLLLLLS
ncbi:MAG: cytochrome oxidase subunit III [Acidobacteria bacterium]|nr:MAG: cytochrome oxidase subunit III [Acidobacteriota bacterium]